MSRKYFFSSASIFTLRFASTFFPLIISLPLFLTLSSIIVVIAGCRTKGYIHDFLIRSPWFSLWNLLCRMISSINYIVTCIWHTLFKTVLKSLRTSRKFPSFRDRDSLLIESIFGKTRTFFNDTIVLGGKSSIICT